MNNKIKTNNKFKYLIGLGLISSLLSSCDMLIRFPSTSNNSNITNSVSSRTSTSVIKASVSTSVTPSKTYDIDRYDYLQFKGNPIYATYKNESTRIYEELYAACKEVTEGNKSYSSNIISRIPYSNFDVACAVYFSFLHSNPEFYFLRNGFEYGDSIINGVSTKVIRPLFDDEYVSEQARNIYDAKLESYKNAFLSKFQSVKLSDTTTQARFIHDYVCDSTYYEYVDGTPSTNKHAHNILGTIDNDNSTGSVCEGYAKTYQLLCDLVGIETITIVGQTSSGGNHMWNYTKNIYSWYGVDVTWDDGKTTNSLKYKYFLATNNVMKADHIPASNNISADIFQVPVPILSN